MLQRPALHTATGSARQSRLGVGICSVITDFGLAFAAQPPMLQGWHCPSVQGSWPELSKKICWVRSNLLMAVVMPHCKALLPPS